MVIGAINSVNMGVIPQPPQRKTSQTAFGATTAQQPEAQYTRQRRNVGQIVFDFLTFLGGAFAGDYAARKLIINPLSKTKNITSLGYFAIAIPFQLVGGLITQSVANKLFNKN